MEDLNYSLWFIYGLYIAVAMFNVKDLELKTNWSKIIMFLYIIPVIAILTEYLAIKG